MWPRRSQRGRRAIAARSQTVVVVLVLLLLMLVLGAHAAKPGPITKQPKPPPAAAAKSPSSTPRACSQHGVFRNPWVRAHVALAYAPETTRDGLGAQAVRLLGIHALAACLGVGYLHAGPQCVGHIGGLPHYQGRDCASRMTRADAAQLARVQRLLALPSSPWAVAVNASTPAGWQIVRLDDTRVTWQQLVDAAQAALQHKRPTLIKLARVQELLCSAPEVFLALPQLRPPAATLPAPRKQQQQQQHLWGAMLLDGSVRVAVHMRRGDIVRNPRHLRRVLPVTYYARAVSSIVQELAAAGRAATVEVFTERPRGRRGRAELAALRRSLPASASVVVHVGTDDLWNWGRMASADVLLLSLSMYGAVPALLNPGGLVITPRPAALDGSRLSVLRMPHWFAATNHEGTLPAAALQALRQRFKGGQQPGSAAAGGASSVAAGGGKKPPAKNTSKPSSASSKT